MLAETMEEERKRYIEHTQWLCNYWMKSKKGLGGISDKDWTEASEALKKIYLEALQLPKNITQEQRKELIKKMEAEVYSKFTGLTALENTPTSTRNSSTR